jgi:hypothetical protein
MLVSTYKFVQSLVLDEFTGSFEDIFNLFMDEKMWYGKWWDHVDEYTSMENVHVIHFETLLEVSFDSSIFFFFHKFKPLVFTF